MVLVLSIAYTFLMQWISEKGFYKFVDNSHIQIHPAGKKDESFVWQIAKLSRNRFTVIIVGNEHSYIKRKN